MTPPSATMAAANSRAVPPPADPAESRRLFFAVFPSIVLPMFLAVIDSTIVSTALPAIAGALGDVERISWIVVSYLVATTIAAPVYGRLGDAFGRKRLLFVALALFIVASGLCAVAPSILALTGARILQGFGGGGLMTLSQALVGEIVPLRERGRYQGYLATVFVCASTIGPVAGGWLTQGFGWKSVFIVNLPLGALAFLLVARIPRRPVSPSTSRFDFLGVALFAGFIAPLLVALEAGQHFDLKALPLVIALLGTSGTALVLLLRQERRASAPLLPIQLLKHPTIWRTDCLAACVGATLVSLVTFLPIYLQVVRGTDPSSTGFLMLPLTGFIAVGSIVTGRLISKTGRTAFFPSCGQPVVMVAMAGLAFLAPVLSLEQLPFLFLLVALFNGTTMPMVQTTVQMLAGTGQLGAASASVQYSRSIGAALGTAITGAVLFGSLAATDNATANLFVQMVEIGPRALQGIDAARLVVMQGQIAHAFTTAFLVIAGFAAMGSWLAWTIPDRRIVA